MSLSTSLAAAVAARRGSCEIPHATTVGARRGSSSKPTRVPSRESLLAECASLPPTHARTSSASAALGGGPGGDDAEVLSSEISLDVDENARTPAGRSVLPMNNVVPTPPTRPETLDAPSPREDPATEAPPPRRYDPSEARQLCASAPVDPPDDARRALRARERALFIAAWCYFLGSLVYLIRYALPGVHSDAADLSSASLFNLGTSAWLWQTLSRACDEELPRRRSGPNQRTPRQHDPEPESDPASESALASRRGWRRVLGNLGRRPSFVAVALFLAGCALSDATVAATTRDDVSAFDATRARRIAERWFVVVPGIVGAAAHAAGTVARTARGNERGDEPGREKPRGSEPSRPSSPDGSLDDEADVFFPETDESSRGPERDADDHDHDHDRDHDHDATSEERRSPSSRLRFSDVTIASSARLAQGPLNLLASFAFLDGSWTAAAAAGDAASLASAAVSAASPTLSESYVVSESLEGVESLRSDLFATCPAADGAATSAAAAARACEVAAESTAPFASSDAAHVAAGALFLASSFAWIVELRAERRLRRDAHATRTKTNRGEEGDDG